MQNTLGRGQRIEGDKELDTLENLIWVSDGRRDYCLLSNANAERVLKRRSTVRVTKSIVCNTARESVRVL